MADRAVGVRVGGQVVAWGWCELPGTLTLLVDPAGPELAGEVLDWFSGVATAAELTVVVLDGETHVLAALTRRGYTRQDAPYLSYLSRSLAELPEPVLPDGFVARAVTGPADLARRVAVHRAAWHPSRVTVDSYRNVMAARATLDWVIEGTRRAVRRELPRLAGRAQRRR